MQGWKREAANAVQGSMTHRFDTIQHHANDFRVRRGELIVL